LPMETSGSPRLLQLPVQTPLTGNGSLGKIEEMYISLAEAPCSNRIMISFVGHICKTRKLIALSRGRST
jgi:hypothetical protein